MVVVAVVEALTRAFIHDGGDGVGGGILVTRRCNSNDGGGSITRAVLGIVEIDRQVNRQIDSQTEGRNMDRQRQIDKEPYRQTEDNIILDRVASKGPRGTYVGGKYR